LILFSL